VTTQVDP